MLTLCVLFGRKYRRTQITGYDGPKCLCVIGVGLHIYHLSGPPPSILRWLLDFLGSSCAPAVNSCAPHYSRQQSTELKIDFNLYPANVENRVSS